MSATPATPPALQEATRKSTVAWQADLQSLFTQAKDRFPDVVWELSDEDTDASREPEEVWGHKAIVYARAPPSFQARYFSFRPPPVASPVPYSASPTGTLPAQSALSLTLGVDFGQISRSPSPFRAVSPAPSVNTGALLRLPTSINPILFHNELEYLYTGKGFGEAFEFLFDTSESREEGDAEENRIDKLRKDLVFMWRSRLYSDVKIALTGTFSSHNHEATTAIFSSHRFILVSRSPYFRAQFTQWNTSSKNGEPLTLTLPSPPFTPASLHFTLGFLYTGTLVFSHRTFDLDTAFHIMRSATYLDLDSLYDEIQARIVQEMMHGLFHAFLEFNEYENITGGKWGTGGCKCRQCARRAPRVLEFACSEDVKNVALERGARRALVGIFGEGWCTPEFTQLEKKYRDSLVRGLGKRTAPLNIFPLLYASHAALRKLENVVEPWGDVSKEMIMAARKTIDDVIATQAAECFEQVEWMDIMEGDGARFEDGEHVEWIMEALRRGMNEKNAAMLYQVLVESILIRPHPSDPDQAMLSSTSHVRVQVEQTRSDVIRWLRRRWINVRQEGGFEGMQEWALKELAQEIGANEEDLLAPTPTTPKGTPTRGTARAQKADDNDAASAYSLRATILNRNAKGTNDPVKSSAASVRSLARSTHSTASRVSTATTSSRIGLGVRPDSKLTPKDNSRPSSPRSSTFSVDTRPPTRRTATTSSRSTATTSSVTPSEQSTPRPKSSAASIRSTRSNASTLRRPVPVASVRAPSSVARASSTLSSATSNGSTAFETAKSEIPPSTSPPRPRRVSTASTVSNISIQTTSSRVIPPRPASSAAKSTPSPRAKRPAVPPLDPTKLSPVAKRSPSNVSMRSTTSTTSVASRKVITTGPRSTPQARTASGSSSKVAPNVLKDKNTLSRAKSHEKQDSTSTVKGTLKRKSSSDTITEPTSSGATSQTLPRGSTLDIGIPCIISHKKARFRAYARYIGEVEGEAGPWVGVEVPISDSFPDERIDDRPWNDGSWGGVRYFDIGTTPEWEYGDSRIRQRRVEWSTGSQTLRKREGDQLSIERAKRLRSASPAISDMSTSESRGLFVRPQQVLYVVDAVA